MDFRSTYRFSIIGWKSVIHLYDSSFIDPIFLAYHVQLDLFEKQEVQLLFNGKPAILIENGKVILKNLKKQFLNVELLLSELRAYDVFDISEV